ASATPIVVLHGLFGSKQNWRSLSKTLAAACGTTVHALDLRNHGDSPHTDVHDYPHMARDVKGYLDARGLERAHIVGHSMGGKVAMHFALTYPSATATLVSVDMVPGVNSGTSEFDGFIRAMARVRDARPATLKQADQLLASDVSDPAVRQFLMTNMKLVKAAGGDGTPRLVNRLNLDALAAHLPTLWQFPDSQGRTYTGPTLVIGGSQSTYVDADRDGALVRRLFPNTEWVMLPTGHWVHAQAPAAFVRAIQRFL
ncbi:hypothetical protein CXG81DRAFT_8182, partial [Caulochytrium protostelioides]